jgi:hypothetical protein
MISLSRRLVDIVGPVNMEVIDLIQQQVSLASESR